MWERKFSDYDVYKSVVTDGFSWLADLTGSQLWENEDSYRLVYNQNLIDWTFKDLKEVSKKDFQEGFEYALAEMEKAEDFDEFDLHAQWIIEQFK